MSCIVLCWFVDKGFWGVENQMKGKLVFLQGHTRFRVSFLAVRRDRRNGKHQGDRHIFGG